MSYEKTVWNNGASPGISAQKLNKIEEGIKSAHDRQDEHQAENMIHEAGGTANAITITTGGDFQYQQGKWLQFKATANNTNNVTINVDGKGSKPFLKVDGSQIAAGGVKTPKIYKAYYDEGSGGRFFLLASAEGDAVVANVLAGKLFSNDDDIGLTGTMPNRAGHVNAQSSSVTGTTLRFRPQEGYYDGTSGNSVQLSNANFVASNIKNGVNLFGVTGNYLGIPFTAGNNLLIANDSSNVFYHAFYTKVREVLVKNAGTIRVSFDIASNLGFDCYGRIYKNGIAVGTERFTNNTNWQTFTQDFSVAANDLIQLYVYQQQDGVAIRNFRVLINMADFIVVNM